MLNLEVGQEKATDEDTGNFLEKCRRQGQHCLKEITTEFQKLKYDIFLWFKNLFNSLATLDFCRLS